jgi:tellurite resistance protein TerC
MPGRGYKGLSTGATMEFLGSGSPAVWGVFLLFVLAMLALDLGVFHRKAHVVGAKEALTWSAVWVTLALLFGGGIWIGMGPQQGLEFYTGYLIEKALAIDNIFVFVAVFGAFGVPAAYQHRVLVWGVLGALVMRAIFIFAGAAMLAKFAWVMYVFGGILLLTGLKMLAQTNTVESAPTESALMRAVRRWIPTTEGFRGDRMLVKEGGRWLATPLLVVLVVIELSDLVFAVDSIPAIFAVTRDPFLVFTSNIFAILGLRSLYFMLASVIDRFHLLKYGLALVLVFVGLKMAWLNEAFGGKFPIGVSLGIIGGILVVSIAASLLIPPRMKK